MRRGRVGEDDRTGRAVEVFRQQPGSHDPAVGFDVFRQSGAAGLDEFLGDDAPAPSGPIARENSGNDAFAGIGVDAGDEIYFFHKRGNVKFRSNVVPLQITSK